MLANVDPNSPLGLLLTAKSTTIAWDSVLLEWFKRAEQLLLGPQDEHSSVCKAHFAMLKEYDVWRSWDAIAEKVNGREPIPPSAEGLHDLATAMLIQYDFLLEEAGLGDVEESPFGFRVHTPDAQRVEKARLKLAMLPAELDWGAPAALQEGSSGEESDGNPHEFDEATENDKLDEEEQRDRDRALAAMVQLLLDLHEQENERRNVLVEMLKGATWTCYRAGRPGVSLPPPAKNRRPSAPPSRSESPMPQSLPAWLPRQSTRV